MMTWRGSWVTWILVAIMALVPPMVEAQPSTSQPSTAQPASAPDQQLLKSEQLDALVAPIALYPDTLLAQVLIASTYPLEVVQADRWVNENKGLQGDKLKAAVDKQSWDENVRSLVATPSVLAMMSAKLDWTQKLGDAVLAQQPDVMDAVQRLRSKAETNKKLVTTKEQKVIVTQQQNKRVIAIEPAVPNTVYVPYYDPAVVYGAWPYPAYPPYYYYPPGYIAGGLLATGLAFGAGYALGRWAGGGYWGGNINWSGGGNNIIINRPGGGGGNWQHRPEHRQGVRYNNTSVQQKYGNNNRGGANSRQDFRGRDGNQVLKPGGDRPGAGTADRPGKGGGGDKGNRPSQGVGKGGGDKGKGAGKAGGDKGNRPSQGKGGGGRDNGMKVQSGKSAKAQSQRGHRSAGDHGISRGGGGRGGGGISRGGGGRGGGGRGGGGRGGGRRSDLMLKHDVMLLGRLANNVGVYRFAYNGSEKVYVGVIAQEVQMIKPEAVTRGRDGYLRVDYEKLGVKFQTYQHWIAEGSRLPQVHSSASTTKTSER